MWPGGLLLTVTSDSPPSVPAIRKQRKACSYAATWSRAERVMVPQRSRPCASLRSWNPVELTSMREARVGGAQRDVAQRHEWAGRPQTTAIVLPWNAKPTSTEMMSVELSAVLNYVLGWNWKSDDSKSTGAPLAREERAPTLRRRTPATVGWPSWFKLAGKSRRKEVFTCGRQAGGPPRPSSTQRRAERMWHSSFACARALSCFTTILGALPTRTAQQIYRPSFASTLPLAPWPPLTSGTCQTDLG